MNVLNPVIIALLAFYISILLLLTAGILRNRARLSRQDNKESRSIIVCARNEEKRIRGLIESIMGQACEKIIVDDRSEDSTRDIIGEYPAITLIRVSGEPACKSPKKAALSKGIEHASGEILLLTDADCVVPPGWSDNMTGYFDGETDAVAGLSYYEEKNIFHKLMNLEMAALSACTEGAIGLGAPIIATGNNLSYRKAAYVKSGGFSGLLDKDSGDDDMMIRRLSTLRKGNVRFAASPDTFTKTFPAATLKEFVNQRSRWASRTTDYGPASTVMLTAAYLFFAIMVVSPVFYIFMPGLFSLLPAAWALSVVAELILLGTALSGYGMLRYLALYPPARVLFALYVVFVPLFSFVKGYKWR